MPPRHGHEEGKWYINNNSILFDANGNLIDGHHRLYAVVVSECTVEMGVIRGADPDSRDTIDSGAARELADHLRFAKMTNSPQRVGYLKACVRSVLGMPVPPEHDGGIRPVGPPVSPGNGSGSSRWDATAPSSAS